MELENLENDTKYGKFGKLENFKMENWKITAKQWRILRNSYIYTQELKIETNEVS